MEGDVLDNSGLGLESQEKLATTSIDGVNLDQKIAQEVLGAKNDIDLVITLNNIPGSSRFIIRGGVLFLGDEIIGLRVSDERFICSLDGVEYVQFKLDGENNLVSSNGNITKLPEGNISVKTGYVSDEGKNFFNFSQNNTDDKCLILPSGEIVDGTIVLRYFDDEYDGAGLYLCNKGLNRKIADLLNSRPKTPKGKPDFAKLFGSE